MALKTKLAAATMLAAAFSMAAEPAEARSYYRYRNRVDVGDVIGGLLVLGTIAAVASAASRASRERYDPRYQGRYPHPDERYDYRTRGDYDRGGSTGIDRAVDMCVAEVERGRGRVGSVDNASRDRDGWLVSGTADNGARFSCRIGNDGRISGVDMTAGGPQGVLNDAQPGVAQDRQWDDEDYVRARARYDNTPPPLPQDAPQDDGRYDTSRGA
jgi:hypothetical protein